MDSKNVTTGCGVKVTYIETQFVTSDAAGFKDLVQRLTGRSSSSAPPPVPPPHRPLPCRPSDGHRRGRTTAAAGAAGTTTTQVYHQYPVMEAARPAIVSRTPPYLLEGMGMGLHDDYINMDDFSDLFYDVGASERSDGCYGGFPY